MIVDIFIPAIVVLMMVIVEFLLLSGATQCAVLRDAHGSINSPLICRITACSGVDNFDCCAEFGACYTGSPAHADAEPFFTGHSVAADRFRSVEYGAGYLYAGRSAGAVILRVCFLGSMGGRRSVRSGDD